MKDTGPLVALKRVTADLRKRHIDHALVGGLAVTVRSEPRFTRDVDLCVAVANDAQAEKLVLDMRVDGYEVVATMEHGDVQRLSTARLRSPEGVVCDLPLASSGIEREVISRATEVRVTDDLSVRVAEVEELLALKVLSSTARRPQDAADVQRLVEHNPDFSRSTVVDDLRLIEVRGYHRGQDLQRKLAEMLRDETVEPE